MGLSYQTLDAIADTYNPALLVASLLLVSYRIYQSPQHLREALRQLGFILIVMAWVYGFMWLDNTYHIWPKFGLDYSTHTAFALSLSVLLLQIKGAYRWINVGVFCAYLALMRYQNYHTVADMLTTALWTLLGVALAIRISRLKFKV